MRCTTTSRIPPFPLYANLFFLNPILLGRGATLLFPFLPASMTPPYAALARSLALMKPVLRRRLSVSRSDNSNEEDVH